MLVGSCFSMTLVGAPSAAQLRVGGYVVALAMRILDNVAYIFCVGMVASSICLRFAVFHCVIFEANETCHVAANA